jgi:hypothetical protein
MEKFMACMVAATVAIAILMIVSAGPSAVDRARRDCLTNGQMWSQGKCYDRP